MAAKRKTAAQAQDTAPETATAETTATPETATAEATTAPVSERQPGDEAPERPRTFAPDPFAIAVDTVAGVRLAESRRNREMQLAFDDKPPQSVIDLVKEYGFHWNSQEKHWTLPVRGSSAFQGRVDAERLFQEVARTLREAKGLAPEQEKTPF